MYCTKCGSKAETSWNVCPTCGNGLHDTDPESQPVVVVVPAAQKTRQNLPVAAYVTSSIGLFFTTMTLLVFSIGVTTFSFVWLYLFYTLPAALPLSIVGTCLGAKHRKKEAKYSAAFYIGLASLIVVSSITIIVLSLLIVPSFVINL